MSFITQTQHPRINLGGILLWVTKYNVLLNQRELSQLKHWLKTTYRISIEEFVVLYKVYADTKISGKELRDTLHFEMLWDTSKIDVIIRKIYKKELISKLRSETDERQVYYFFDAKQKKLLDKMTGEIETISIAN